MASFFSFLATSSFLYMGYYGLTSIQYSLAFACNAMGFFTASQLAANLGARFGPVQVIKTAVTGFSMSAAVLFVLVYAGFDSFYLLVGLLFCTYAFLGVVLPTAMVLSLEDHGPIAGTAAALGGTLQMVTGAVAIAIVSAVFNNTPFPLACTILTCAVVALGLAHFSLKHPVSIPGTPE